MMTSPAETNQKARLILKAAKQSWSNFMMWRLFFNVCRPLNL